MTKTNSADWLFFAESDMKLAESAIDKAIYHLACFHAQQAAKKYLKAYLAQKGLTIPKVHSLKELYEFLQPHVSELEQFLESLRVLDQYYIPTRYPDALPGTLPEGLPTKEHAEKALSDVKKLSDFIYKKISPDK